MYACRRKEQPQTQSAKHISYTQEQFQCFWG